MIIFLFLFALILFVLLVAVAALVPNAANVSRFELERRKKNGDTTIELDVLREGLYQDIVSIQRALTALLLVFFVLIAVATFGGFIGVLVGVIVALEYGAVARLRIVQANSQKLYNRYEKDILSFCKRHESALRWVRTVVPVNSEVRVASKDELKDVIERSHGVLSNDEKIHALSSLRFEAKNVRDIMTPRSVVETIGKDEVLGPLTLDGLHKTGYSRFPVIENDIDHVLGILHVRDVLGIDMHKKQTTKVDAAMSKKVFYIREDHTLAQALSAFLRTRNHLFIVINEFHETVGILTLEDVLESLIGRKIVDEFDEHDDMRAVAKRQAKKLSSTTTNAVND